MLPRSLTDEIEAGLRKRERMDLAATVGSLPVHRCTAGSTGAWIFTTARTLTPRERQIRRLNKTIPREDIQGDLARAFTWPPDEIIVLPRVQVCLWAGVIEQLRVTKPGMDQPALRKLAQKLGDSPVPLGSTPEH